MSRNDGLCICYHRLVHFFLVLWFCHKQRKQIVSFKARLIERTYCHLPEEKKNKEIPYRDWKTKEKLDQNDIEIPKENENCYLIDFYVILGENGVLFNISFVLSQSRVSFSFSFSIYI